MPLFLLFFSVGMKTSNYPLPPCEPLAPKRAGGRHTVVFEREGDGEIVVQSLEGGRTGRGGVFFRPH